MTNLMAHLIADEDGVPVFTHFRRGRVRVEHPT